jgi:hypothetical protein
MAPNDTIPSDRRTGVDAVSPVPMESKDPEFAQADIDVDEWRDAPVHHRYVHGSFTGTDTKFSFY